MAGASLSPGDLPVAALALSADLEGLDLSTAAHVSHVLAGDTENVREVGRRQSRAIALDTLNGRARFRSAAHAALCANFRMAYLPRLSTVAACETVNVSSSL
jgi:hypothetical protein